MKSILDKAKEKSKKEQDAMDEERNRSKRIQKSRNELEKRIRHAINKILSPLDGQPVKLGTLTVNKGVVSIKRKDGHNDIFVFSLKYDDWFGTWRGSDESPEEEYYSQRAVLKTPGLSLSSDDRERRFGFGEYEFQRYVDLEEELSDILKDLV